MMGMRSRFFGPGEVRLALLSLIAETPKHGYELMRQLEERSGGIYNASAGTVYPTLQQLEDEGLISSDSKEGKRVTRSPRPGSEELKREDENRPQNLVAGTAMGRMAQRIRPRRRRNPRTSRASGQSSLPRRRRRNRVARANRTRAGNPRACDARSRWDARQAVAVLASLHPKRGNFDAVEKSRRQRSRAPDMGAGAGPCLARLQRGWRLDRLAAGGAAIGAYVEVLVALRQDQQQPFSNWHRAFALGTREQRRFHPLKRRPPLLHARKLSIERISDKARFAHFGPTFAPGL